MRKFLVFLFAILALALLAVYIFIPGKLVILKTQYVNCNVNGAFRIISDQSSWIKWWPNKDSAQHDFSQNRFFYNGYSYDLTNRYYNSVEVFIRNKEDSIISRINLIKLNPDSVLLEWKCILNANLNPFTRISNYKKAENINRNTATILSHLRSFLEKKENIYGVNFHITMSNDSTMVAIKKLSKNYPSTSDIYALIGSLTNYIKAQGAKENNFPMLNIRKQRNKEFETMVAIPVNKQLPGNGNIFFSRFVPWKVVTGEVRGGVYTANAAMHQMEIYISDYQKTTMAIPFQSLVTNRMEEPDTLKWITRMYTPVP